MMTKKLLILGTGYTGRELAFRALNEGYEVAGTTRSQQTLRWLEDRGVRAIAWSVGDDPDPWLEFADSSTHVVYSIPTLFRSYQSADGDEYPRHVRPVANVVSRCQDREIERFVYLSSTSVYGDHGGDWVDESTDCHPESPYGKMRLDIESHLRRVEVDFPIYVARLVGIYGPGRTLVDAIDQGRYTLVDNGKKVTNRIHVVDIARGILALLQRGPDQFRTFNFTDGHPQQVRDLVEFICDETGMDRPIEESLEEFARRRNDANALARWKKQIRVLNDRLRRELNFDLVYPDVFAGYRDILTEDTAPVPG